MIKQLFALALLFACAGEGPEQLTDYPQSGLDNDYEDRVVDNELGQLSQTLLVPDFYGNASGSGGYKCFPGMTANCNVPATKSVKFKFEASTCSSWWQTRVVEAEVKWKATIQGAGWTYTSGGSGPFTVRLRCNQSSTPTCSSDNGSYACNKNLVSTCSSGKCKVTYQDIYLETYLIEHDTFEVNWPAQTELKRQNFAVSVSVHEMGHTVGSGHDVYPDYGQDPDVDPVFFYGDAMYVNSSYALASKRTISTPWLISDMKNYQP